MYCNGLKLSGALEEFSITSRFLGSIECSFYRIQVKLIANLPSRLEKTHQTLDILLMTEVFIIFKKNDFILNF